MLPAAIFLKVVDHASLTVLTNLTLAALMGIAMALMSTFFVTERGMRPVIHRLLRHGIAIPYDSLPVSKLRLSAELCALA